MSLYKVLLFDIFPCTQPQHQHQHQHPTQKIIMKLSYSSSVHNAHKTTLMEMRVHMDCAGCETKIKKALHKLKGVDDVDVDIAMQKVTVMGWADQKKVLKAVRKTGRIAELWPYPCIPESYNYYQRYYYNYSRQRQQPEIDDSFTYNGAVIGSSIYTDSSSYNYRKHGYIDLDSHGYYQRPPYSTLVDEQASSLFSDENPHACMIM
ncbi:hypothetical protein K2173_001501 [Erythroxylum novogranatense]|uniref:HMA domain-containing protein n=1 Tax=Erythroxylum novogranatense TaxID=1862640 RepID=A0AAV8T4S8_9ROSI|nr:hypothetical protein K2173_001501 [Erythroxylum novogranatense]